MNIQIDEDWCFPLFSGRLQLEADRHTDNIKNRDNEVSC